MSGSIIAKAFNLIKSAEKLTTEIGKLVPKELKEEFNKGFEKFSSQLTEKLNNSETLNSFNISDKVKSFSTSIENLSNTLDQISINLKNIDQDKLSSLIDNTSELINEIQNYVDNLEKGFTDVDSFNYDEYGISQIQLEKAEELLNKLEGLIKELPDVFEPDEIDEQDLEELIEAED